MLFHVRPAQICGLHRNLESGSRDEDPKNNVFRLLNLIGGTRVLFFLSVKAPKNLFFLTLDMPDLVYTNDFQRGTYRLVELGSKELEDCLTSGQEYVSPQSRAV